MEIKEGITIPESSNIFSNIGTVFSGLSHEKKIINLEKFLKDISLNDEINSTPLYRNFLETENLFNELRIKRKNSNFKDSSNNLQNNNNINKRKMNNTSSLSHNNNQIRNSSYSNNIENKLEKMVREIKANKAYKKIPINNKTLKELKFSIGKINN